MHGTGDDSQSVFSVLSVHSMVILDSPGGDQSVSQSVSVYFIYLFIFLSVHSMVIDYKQVTHVHINTDSNVT